MYDAASAEGRETAETLLRQHSDMVNERSNWDTLWERIAELLFPRAQQFTSKDQTQGQLRGESVFDNTPTLALDRYAAAVGSMVAPETSQYHGLKAADPDIAEDDEIKEYCEAATRALFAARYAPRANFSSQAHECWLSDGAFGTYAMFVDEDMGRNMRYRTMHMAEIYLGENHQGIVDRVHRGKFKLKAYQVAQLCNKSDDDPRRWIMPRCVAEALGGTKPNPNAEFEFLHCVYPNEQIDERRNDYAGMMFASTYVCVTDQTVVNRSGYRTMPYAVGRHTTGPNETYGRSPAMTVFRDVLMLNEMNKTIIRAGQLHVDPPYLIAEDASLAPFQVTPRALNYGYIDQDGRPMAQSLRPDGDLSIGLEMIQDRRQSVNDAFWIRLFQVLVETPDMTATQALLRAQEKGQLLGPTMGRKQSEFMSVIIERELDVLSAAGALPHMPDRLLEAGGAMAIEWRNPLSRLQRTDDAVGIIRGIEALQPLAAINPKVYNIIDPVKAARIVMEAQGAPADVIYNDEELAAQDEQEQAQVNLDTLIKAAPGGARAIKDLAQARAVAGNSPPAIPFVQPEGG